MTRILAGALAALIATGAATAAAHGATFTPTAHLPGAPDQVLAVSAHGTGAVVISGYGPIYGGKALTIDAVRDGKAVGRSSIPNASVYDTVATPDGGADVLVGRSKGNRAAVLRVSPAGKVSTLWSGSTTSLSVTNKQLAVAGDGTVALAYLVRRERDNSVRLMLARSTGNRKFSRAIEVRGVLPKAVASPPKGQDYGYVDSLAVALDAKGRAVMGATPSYRPGGDGTPRNLFVMATADASGKVLRRQIAGSTTGLVNLTALPDGRVAALVEDTGIEGEVGECVQDGHPHGVSTAFRAASGQLRFSRVTRLFTRPLSCPDTLTSLVPGRSGEVSAVWGTAPDTGGPASVVAATAGADGTFGKPVVLATNAALRGAAYAQEGTLLAFATIPLPGVSPYDNFQPGTPAVVSETTAAPLDFFPTALAGPLVVAPAKGTEPVTIAWTSTAGIEVGTIR